jgi:hypothetical protein
MNHEEHDDLWTLLGKARQPKPSAFFASKVMRAVREDATPQPGFVAWLRSKWYLPVAAGACAAVLAILAMRPVGTPNPAPGADPLEGIAIAATATPDIIPSLDTLLASEDNSIWLAGDASSLY